jgi:peptide/nickel transport system substrate-binding protein
MMFKKIAIVAGLGLALAATAEAQTPRKGGTIRMTAPYGSSFTSMDIHTTQRAQDEIFAKGLHRSLYIWDSAEGKPVPELAKEVIVSGGGLVHTFKLRDDAYFHHGR